MPERLTTVSQLEIVSLQLHKLKKEYNLTKKEIERVEKWDELDLKRLITVLDRPDVHSFSQGLEICQSWMDWESVL